MNVKKMIEMVNKNCKSSKGFMGVNFDGVKNENDLIENIKDEILSITEVIENSDIEEEFGMTVREAKGYIKKLNTFVNKYEAGSI